MWRSLKYFFGPRVPFEELRRRPVRYLLPSLLFIGASIILYNSYSKPYWNMTLHAPQYPKGLHVQAYLDRLEGDVGEIDGLNHYIGMRPLNEAAQLERQTSWMAITAMALLLLAAILVHSPAAVVLSLPALLFPIGFLADLYYWLHNFGQNLDPTAALSNSVKPFTPPVLGEGYVGQFRTVAGRDAGLTMAWIASAITFSALAFHFFAYRPLWKKSRKANEQLVFCPRCEQVVPRAPGNREPANTCERPVTLFTAGGTGATALLLALFASFAVGSSAAADDTKRPFDLVQAVAAAPDGATVKVPVGIHRGPVVIDRPITLLGESGAIIDGGGVGDVLRVESADVTITNFVLRGTGTALHHECAAIRVTAPRATIIGNTIEDSLFGILLKGAEGSVVRGNAIRGKDLDIARRGDGIRLWQASNSILEDNTVTDGRDVVLWYSSNVQVRRNHVSNSRYGLHFMFTDDNTLDNNILEGNSVGCFLMYSKNLTLRGNIFRNNRGPSGYGLGLKDMDGVVAQANIFLGNRVGIYLDNSPSSMHIHHLWTRNLIACNDVGIAFMPSVKRNDFAGNNFIDNIEQIAVLSGGEFTGNSFTVKGAGNYWSDYAGYDLDGDEIGDLDYRAESLFENLMDREPKLRLFLYSPAQQAVELASRAFPAMRPRPKITDHAPLMYPSPVRAAFEPPRSHWPLAAVAAGLLSCAGCILLGGLPDKGGTP